MTRPTKPLIKFLTEFSSRMRTDLVARYHPPVEAGQRGTYSPHRASLTAQDLERHLTGEQAIGLYLLQHDLGIVGCTKAACLDLDDRKKKLTWLQICQEGTLLRDALKTHNLQAWPVRSGSGHGLHLWFFWDEPQLASTIRQVFKDTVKSLSLKTHIDIFPAQDKLGKGNDGEWSLGNLVALPLGRESRPISDLERGTVVENLGSWLPVSPPVSAPLTTAGMDMADLARDAGRGGVTKDDGWAEVDPETLAEALTFVDNSTYDQWMKVGMALKAAARDGQLTEAEAERLWEAWARTSDKFDPKAQRNNWRSFNPSGELNLGTIWYQADRGGWRPKSLKRPKETIDKVHEKLKPTLKGLTDDEKAARKRFPWLAGQATEHIAELNKTYFVAEEGGKAFIFKEGYDETMKRNKLVRMSATDFRLIHQNQKIHVSSNKKGGTEVVNLGDAWLDDAHRRQYESIVLQPEGTVPWVYNMWKGWAVEPSEDGSCELFLEHIRKNVCGGDKAVYEYLLNWTALTFQKPYEPIGTAVVLRGERGTGKGTFARVLGDLFGQHFLHLTNSRDLTGRFNSHLQDCILLFADEAVWAGSKAEESTLKGIITEPSLTIEGKGRDLIQTRNMLHIIIATNNEWSIPAGLDERRFLALKVAETNKQDPIYFRAIYDQLNKGGKERLLWELLNRDVSNFVPSKLPHTEELLEQKVKSLDPWVEWWYHKLMTGQVFDFLKVPWEEPVCLQVLYLDYVQHCRLAGVRVPGAVSGLTLKLKTLLPSEPKSWRGQLKTSINNGLGEVAAGSKQTMWQLPSLAECRAHFNKKAQQHVHWELDEVPELPLVGPDINVEDDEAML